MYEFVQLKIWPLLVGQIIKAVIDQPNGIRACDVLIITESKCWMALEAESGGCDEASDIRTVSRYYGDVASIADYASPNQLLRAGVIDDDEYKQLEAIRDEKKKKRDAQRAQSLRAELARLEGGME